MNELVAPKLIFFLAVSTGVAAVFISHAVCVLQLVFSLFKLSLNCPRMKCLYCSHKLEISFWASQLIQVLSLFKAILFVSFFSLYNRASLYFF